MGQETGCLGARRGSLLSRRVSPKFAHNLRPRSPTHLGRQCQDFEVVWKPGMQAILSHSREAVTMGATFWIELGAFRAAQAHIWSPRHPFPGPEHLSEMPESPNYRHLSCTCKDAWIQACTHTNSGSTSACRVWHFAVVNQTLNPFITINLQTCRAWNWHQLVPHHEVWESLFQRCHNLLVACKRAFQPCQHCFIAFWVDLFWGQGGFCKGEFHASTSSCLSHKYWSSSACRVWHFASLHPRPLYTIDMQTCEGWHQLYISLLQQAVWQAQLRQKCHSRFHHLWCSNTMSIAPHVARSFMKCMRDHSGLAWCQILPRFPSTRCCILAQLRVPQWTALISACASILLQIFSRLYRIDIVRGAWMPPWWCSSVSWGLN